MDTQRIEFLIAKAEQGLTPEETAEAEKLLDEVDDTTIQRLERALQISEVRELERKLEDPNAVWVDADEFFKKFGRDGHECG